MVLFLNYSMLRCQIRTARFLLGLVVLYPPWFFELDGFFIFYPCGFYSGCGFSKVPGDASIRRVFHIIPCGFLGIIVLHPTPVVFIQPAVFQKCLVMFL